MRLHHASLAFAILAFAGGQAGAQPNTYDPRRAYEPIAPRALPAPGLLLTAQGKEGKAQDPKDKEKDKDKEQAPVTDAFAQSPTAGGEAPSGINPRMIGDFPGYFALRTITVPSVQTITQFRPQQVIVNGQVTIQQVPFATQQVPVNVTTVTRVLLPGHAAAKVADNQSPQPEDRVFLSYNYFNGARGSDAGIPGARTDTQAFVQNGQLTTITTVNPGVPAPRVDLHYETFGFEKSFLDGNASIGVRVPIFQMQGDGSMSQNDFGDLTVLFKYAFINDRATGNILSGGLAVTAPTGPAFDTIAGTFHSTLLQPYAGARMYFDRFYVQGFSSLVIPTDSRDVTTFFNDVGVGYWLTRGGPGQLLPAIIPTVEAHVATPLNHRSGTDPMYAPDLVTITTGVHLGLTNRSMLTIGVATPVTGPRLFDVEAVVQFNFRF